MNLNIWSSSVKISESGFKHKSLCVWTVNIAVGCGHGCLFCYVPNVSTNKQAKKLALFGVKDPEAEWGKYVLLRKWDADVLAESLLKAKNKTASPDCDGRQAIMFCSTTDPYQTVTGKFQKEFNEHRRTLVREALRMIHEYSDLNMRILTRSPLAREDFGLFKEFGDRLVFGMSLPTLNDAVCKRYEPDAPRGESTTGDP